MISVEDLAKYFHDKKRGAVHALDGISFEASAGEIFGLLGPNGAGKTTTLRLLSTILRPTSGTARVNGADITRNPEVVRQQIGFASGDMGQYGRLTPRETLSFFGQLNGLPKALLQARVEETIEQFDIGGFADTKTDNLSTGMKQKVAIARTVVHDPPVLILDEPSAGLDVPAARLIEEFMLSAKRAGKCILFSTHVMEEAEYLCDRVGVVNQGKLTAVGTMEELRLRTGKQRLREIFLDLLGFAEPFREAHA
jgi:sodium transport system ATP-binding protein